MSSDIVTKRLKREAATFVASLVQELGLVDVDGKHEQALSERIGVREGM